MDAFSVNNKGRQEIMEHIELLYTATGAKGLAEKYGYVLGQEENKGNEINDFEINKEKTEYDDYIRISDDLISQIYTNDSSIRDCAESANFVLSVPNSTLFSFISTIYGSNKKKYKYYIFDKRNNTKIEFEGFNSPLQSIQRLPCRSDTFVVELGSNEKSIELFDLPSQKRNILATGDQGLKLLRVKENYVVYSQRSCFPDTVVRIYIYDALMGKTKEVPILTSKYGYYREVADIDLQIGSLYLIDSEQIVYQIDLKKNFICKKQWKVSIPGYPGAVEALRVTDTYAFCWSKEGLFKDYLSKLDFESGRSQLLTNISKDSLLDRKNLYENFFVYREGDDGPLYGVRLESFEVIRFTASQPVGEFLYFNGYVYFQRDSRNWYRVNIDNPTQVEAVM